MKDEKEEEKTININVHDSKIKQKVSGVSLIQFQWVIERKPIFIVTYIFLMLINWFIGYYFKNLWSILISLALNLIGIWVGFKAFIKVQRIVT
jgi:hypothetical protein